MNGIGKEGDGMGWDGMFGILLIGLDCNWNVLYLENLIGLDRVKGWECDVYCVWLVSNFEMFIL